jgi:hypothetical protein
MALAKHETPSGPSAPYTPVSLSNLFHGSYDDTILSRSAGAASGSEAYSQQQPLHSPSNLFDFDSLMAPRPPRHHLQVPSRLRIKTLNHKARLRLIRWDTTSYSQRPTTHLPPAVTRAARRAKSCQCAVFLVAYSSISIVRFGS